MRHMDNPRYRNLLRLFCENCPVLPELDGKTILISGATGMLGSFLVDAVMTWNQGQPVGKRCGIIAVNRGLEKAKARFHHWKDHDELQLLQHDVCEPFPAMPEPVDYIIHAASTTHPVEYATRPINTIVANVLGAQNLLEIAAEKKSRFLMMSSVEIYGSNRGDTEYFTEDYCGYIDCNTLRAGYPEAKRVSEALCHAYHREKQVDFAIIRLPRCYGPTMQMTDSKAIAQFIKKAVNNEDIVLKSEGDQLYSYTYTFDAVSALLWVLLRGKSGEVYNAGDSASDITLRDLAELIAGCVGRQVVFDLPDETEKQGYSKAQKALMDGSKLKNLGWTPRYDIASGIAETIEILKNDKGESN